MGKSAEYVNHMEKIDVFFKKMQKSFLHLMSVLSFKIKLKFNCNIYKAQKRV